MYRRIIVAFNHYFVYGIHKITSGFGFGGFFFIELEICYKSPEILPSAGQCGGSNSELCWKEKKDV